MIFIIAIIKAILQLLSSFLFSNFSPYQQFMINFMRAYYRISQFHENKLNQYSRTLMVMKYLKKNLVE